MIGDSRNQAFAYYELIDGANVWGTEGLTPFKMDKNLLHHGTFEKRSIDELMAKYPPQIVMYSMGVECVGGYTAEEIYTEYKAYLEGFMDKYPDVEIVIHSMMPVHEKYDLKPINMWHPSNQKINNANYYLAQMCEELGIYFIDSSSVLKNEKGLGDPKYFTEDNVHLSREGQEKVFKYILSHALLIRVITLVLLVLNPFE